MLTRAELEEEFAGPGWHGRHGKGAARRLRLLRRYQAEDRNAATPPERRRVHRKAMQAKEAEKVGRSTTRREHIKQRQWIAAAKEAREGRS